jgi:hypothetical protein
MTERRPWPQRRQTEASADNDVEASPAHADSDVQIAAHADRDASPAPHADSEVSPRVKISAHPSISLRQALGDPNLLGHVLAGESWSAWRTLLIAAMGEPLTDDERVIFTQLTQREREPLQRVDEFVGVIGRRGGKSRAISVLAAYIAGLCQHPMLVRDETGIVLCIAPDQDQATILLDYITATFESSPILRQLIEQRTRWTLKLTNHLQVDSRAADFRRLRGPSYVSVCCDESGFFYNNEGSANPDSEILNSVRPGLATTRGPLFIISSPYARRGELWNLYNSHFGPNGDPRILVAQAASRVMNPSLPEFVVNRAMQRDPASASAEYMAAFRSDLEQWAAREAIEACVARTVYERAPQIGHSYRAFIDPSGGASDSMTMCCAHYVPASQTVVVDCLREAKPPFSPETVCQQFAEVLKTYRCVNVVSDKYGGVWPVEQMAKFGIRCTQSAAPKSDLYQTLLPLINSGRIELLDHPKTVNQLAALEQRNTRGVRPTIDHPPGQHDDLANAIAGSAAQCLARSSYNLAVFGDHADAAELATAEYRKKREEAAQYRANLLRTVGAPVRLMPLMPREEELR